MAVIIDDSILETTKLSEEDLKLQIAIYLYKSEQLSAGKAGEIVGLSRPDFLYELGKYKISWNYGTNEFAEDLKGMSNIRFNSDLIDKNTKTNK